MDDLNEFAKLENALVRAGREFDFPATPALAPRVRAALTPTRVVPSPARNWTRVLAPLAAALILALALLLALPDAREAVAQFLGLRGLRIFYVTPTPTAAPTRTSPPTPLLQGEGSETPRPNIMPTATPRATRTPTVQPFTLCCATTLEDAQKRARFKLLLPPDESPSRVYYQNIFDTGEQVVMVFGDPANPRFTLYQAQRWVYGKLLGGSFGKEAGPQTLIDEAEVHGNRALWFSGAPHVLMVLDARGEPIYRTERVVDANTLVWETGNEYDGIIYRIETKSSLAEAVRFAESLQ